MQTCCSDSVNVNVLTGLVEVQLHDVARKAPLLLTELVVTTDSSDFCYSTPIDTIASRIISVFDRAMTKLQVGASLRGSASQWNRCMHAPCC